MDELENAELKADCFAYNAKRNLCNGLNELYCAKEKCRFYMNVEDYKKHWENAHKGKEDIE